MHTNPHSKANIMTSRITANFRLGLTSAMGALHVFSSAANAGSRHFAYTYETTTMTKGAMELESSVTWKSEKQADPGFERFDIRHEFEYGVTDRLQLAFYFADWRHESSSGHSSKTSFQDMAVEAIYNLTDPNTTPFGSALYGEIKGSEDFIQFEGKFLLQKNIASWILAYNVGGEITWKDDYQNDEAELMQSAGVSFQFNPSFSAGFEVLHEIAVPDVDTIGDSGVYAGPNIAWRKDRISATLTGLWQVTSLADEPDFQLRTIVSFDF